MVTGCETLGHLPYLLNPAVCVYCGEYINSNGPPSKREDRRTWQGECDERDQACDGLVGQ